MGLENNFNTEAKSTIEKLSKMLNVETANLEKFLTLFLLSSPEKAKHSLKHFKWQLGTSHQTENFVELLYTKIKSVHTRKKLILSGKINELIEINTTSTD